MIETTCQRWCCGHAFDEHYVTNGGREGCSEITGADGESCCCAGFADVEPEEDRVEREALEARKGKGFGPSSFVPAIWGQGVLRIVETNAVLRRL